MYIDFFGFKDKPFRLTPEPTAFYCSPNHDRAITMLEYGINSRKGFMLFYGLAGSGRTTLCLLLKETLVSCNVSYVAKTADEDLLGKICSGFALNVEKRLTENEFFGILIDYFVSEYKKGRNNLIIVDDADEYSTDTFRMLEKLSEVEIEQCKLVQILVVGTQELCNKLKYGKKDLNERVLFVTEISPLSLNDTANYLQHRIKIVKGTDPDILKRTAVIEIFRYSHGIPLEINLVAGKAFKAASESKDKKVGPKHVRVALQQISGVRPPLRRYTASSYIMLVLTLLVLVLGGMQVRTFFAMKKIEVQYAETKQSTEHVKEEAETIELIKTLDEKADVLANAKIEEEKVVDTEVAIEAEPVAEPIVEPVIKYGCITAKSGLKLRAGANASSNVVGVALYDTNVVLLERVGDWWKSEVNGVQGFLFAEYVTEDICD